MTTMAPAPLHLLTCRDTCPSASVFAEHHRRLLTVDTDPDEMLALIELAVTWHELDYSGIPVVGPAEWLTFAERHAWNRPDRAEMVFGLAVDIVGRGAAGPPPARREASAIVDLIRR